MYKGKRMHLGVMRKDPASFSEIEKNFEEFPKSDSALYIPYVFDENGHDSSITYKDPYYCARPVDAILFLRNGGNEKKLDIPLDVAIEKFATSNSGKNLVVVVGIGYIALKHYMESRYGSVAHLPIYHHYYDNKAPKRHNGRKKSTHDIPIPSDWAEVARLGSAREKK